MTSVWCADDTLFGEMIFLDDSNLIVDLPEEKHVDRMRDALLGGTAPAAVLSSESTNIPLLAVTKISIDRHDEDIEIEYREGKETKDKTLRLTSRDKRDEVYAQLKTAFGEKFAEHRDDYSVLRAVYASLVALTIFGFLTWVFAAAAAEIRAGEAYDTGGDGAKALFAAALNVMGPVGVSVLGGVICAVYAFAAFLNVRQPPSMLILQAEPYKAQGPIKTAVKYGILLLMWAFLAKVFLF